MREIDGFFFYFARSVVGFLSLSREKLVQTLRAFDVMLTSALLFSLSLSLCVRNDNDNKNNRYEMFAARDARDASDADADVFVAFTFARIAFLHLVWLHRAREVEGNRRVGSAVRRSMPGRVFWSERTDVGGRFVALDWERDDVSGVFRRRFGRYESADIRVLRNIVDVPKSSEVRAIAIERAVDGSDGKWRSHVRSEEYGEWGEDQSVRISRVVDV